MSILNFPQCKYQDYKKYLRFKTGYIAEESLDNFIAKELFIKYANIIRRFLSYLFQKEVLRVKNWTFQNSKKSWCKLLFKKYERRH